MRGSRHGAQQELAEADSGGIGSDNRFVLRVSDTSTYNYFTFLISNSFFNQSDNQIILLVGNIRTGK